MKLHVILPLFLFALLTLPAQAQDGYRLRVPTAEEYVQDIPTLIDHAHKDTDYYGLSAYRLTLINNLALRYPAALDTLDYDSLNLAYEALYHDLDGRLASTLPHREDWNRALVLAKVRADHIDFAEQQQWQFDNFDIQITPRDFNQDGISEFTLDVIKNCQGYCRSTNRSSAEYADYIVLQANDNDYTWIPSPLPPLGRDYHYRAIQSGKLKEIAFDDINADGLPEWVVEYTGTGYYYGQLFVIAWRDGVLANITPPIDCPSCNHGGNASETLSYINYSWFGEIHYELKQLDTDPALEISLSEPLHDNFGCRSTRISHFDYDPHTRRYIFLERQRTFEETPNCTLRFAETAFQAKNYETAISYYQQALNSFYQIFLEPGNPEVADHFDVYANYAIGRLAIAYALSGQIDRIEQVFKDIPEVYRNSDSPDSGFRTAIYSAYLAEPTPEAVCRAAHHYVEEHNLNLEAGWVVDSDFYPLMSSSTIYNNPNKAGCDMRQFDLQPTTPIPTPQPEPAYRLFMEALDAGDYPAALTLLDNEISRNQDSYRENPYMLYARQFTRAFILEALSRPDEALAEYVAIYEAAPESAWGMLAALHFERSDGGE